MENNYIFIALLRKRAQAKSPTPQKASIATSENASVGMIIEAITRLVIKIETNAILFSKIPPSARSGISGNTYRFAMREKEGEGQRKIITPPSNTCRRYLFPVEESVYS